MCCCLGCEPIIARMHVTTNSVRARHQETGALNVCARPRALRTNSCLKLCLYNIFRGLFQYQNMAEVCSMETKPKRRAMGKRVNLAHPIPWEGCVFKLDGLCQWRHVAGYMSLGSVARADYVLYTLILRASLCVILGPLTCCVRPDTQLSQPCGSCGRVLARRRF